MNGDRKKSEKDNEETVVENGRCKERGSDEIVNEIVGSTQRQDETMDSAQHQVEGSEQDNGRDTRRRGLCRDGKQCPSIETCPFIHETIKKPCRFGVNCNRKQSCLFMHVRVGAASDVHQGTAPQPVSEYQWPVKGYRHAQYMHQHRSWDENDENFDGRYQFGMENYNNNYNNNRSYRRLCAKGRSCKTPGCSFGHDQIRKQCRDGVNCSRKDSCLFSHNEENGAQAEVNDRAGTKNSVEIGTNVSNVNMNQWLRRAKN